MIFVLLKYCLEFAKDRPSDMLACMRLACAKNQQNVLSALGHVNSGSFQRHRYLFQSFTVVYWLVDGRVVEDHSDFMHDTQTEHTLFVQGLVRIENWKHLRFGEKSSRPQNVE